MSKVMLWGPAPWCRTGYGNNLRQIGHRLKEADHEVIHFALTGLNWGKVEYNDIMVLPNDSGDYGQAWLPRWCRFYNPDVVLFHYDSFVLGSYKPPSNVKFIWYSPVDHSPCPPPVVASLKAGGGTVVAMTRFAGEQFLNAGIRSTYIPHAVDTKIYHPGDRGEARNRLELPEDSFILASVATNKGPRKNLANLLRAYRDFLDAVPSAREDSFLFMHTNITSGPMNKTGYNLERIWNDLGIADRIKYTHPLYYEGVGFTDDEIADVYRASDWTLSVALGEGFCIPACESLACGTPVIYSDCSALPEVVGGGGLPVKWIDRIPFELSSSFQWIVSTEDITAQITAAYRDWQKGGQLRDTLGRVGLDHVLEEYTYEKTMPQWLKLISDETTVIEPCELTARADSVRGEVDIIVITHNHIDLLQDCIESIYANTTNPFHLIVVDDQSDDDTAEYLGALHQQRDNLTVIRPAKKAEGGAEVMNIGLRYCRNDRLVSMNNDIIVEKGWLEEALAVVDRDPAVGIVGMKFLYPDGKIQHAGGVFIKEGLPFHIGMGEPRDRHSDIVDAPWVSGPCVLIRRDCLGTGWDEMYDTFGGHEDIDICLRARKAGWKVVYCGKSEVVHREGATVLAMDNFAQMHTRARQIFMSRWGGTKWVK